MKRADGFSLIELLVVMIVIGMLASIAVPAFLSQRRLAFEASAKVDVRNIVKEALDFYIDSSGVLTISGTAPSWQLASGSDVFAAGTLSKGNSISVRSYVNGVDSYCISIRNAQSNSRFWSGNGTGLNEGDC